MTMSLVIVLAVTAISITCVATAAWLAWHQRKGWGWFLFVAFLVAATLPSASRVSFWADDHQFRHSYRNAISAA